MKCGERIVRCLTGGDVDRVPFGVGLGWHPWGGAIECWRQESGNPSLDPASVFGNDFKRTLCPHVRSSDTAGRKMGELQIRRRENKSFMQVEKVVTGFSLSQIFRI
jgi:hypothetical protein